MRAAGLAGVSRRGSGLWWVLSFDVEIPPRLGLPSCREKGSGAVIRHVHGMAVPADGRCVRVDGAGGPGAAAGLPVVPGAGGVLVGLLAACPPAGTGAEDLHTAGAVPCLRGDSCAAAGVHAGPAAGRGRYGGGGGGGGGGGRGGGGGGARAGRGGFGRGAAGGGRGGGAAYDGAGLGAPVRRAGR